MYRNKKAAVFILLGQSNAVGHDLPMKENDKIIKPLKNVFGLRREKNQSFDIKELCWDEYTSFGMNLAEEQDHTYSIANCLAKLWQNEIDSGNKDLPDLYIIQIAIGAQGVTNKYMWNPDYEKKLIPGKLGIVDISLYEFTLHILSLVNKSLYMYGNNKEIIGIHWRGGENDTTVQFELLQTTLMDLYNKIFGGFCNALEKKVPVILHKLVCHERCIDLDPSGLSLENMHYINNIFSKLASENDNIKIFDVSKAPHFAPDIRGNGIFIGDVVHYTAQTNYWVSEQILNDYKKSLHLN